MNLKDYNAKHRSEWLINLKVFKKQWQQDVKKPKLQPLDLKLYKEVKENKEPEIIKIGKEYFGDKAVIKE